jgi:hypothetical protein
LNFHKNVENKQLLPKFVPVLKEKAVAKNRKIIISKNFLASTYL